MTDDAWRFRHRDWLLERGCVANGSALIAPQEEWYREREGEFIPGTRYIVPQGTKYIVTAEKPPETEKKRGAHGVTVQSVSGLSSPHVLMTSWKYPSSQVWRMFPFTKGEWFTSSIMRPRGMTPEKGVVPNGTISNSQARGLLPHYYVIGSPSEYPLRGAFVV